MMTAEKLVKSAIEKYDMPSADTHILVGFSGGSDSVCLLSVLKELGYKLTACHLNHNMRDTAMRDMLFCESFCRERDIPFIAKTLDKDSVKSEADARNARYSFFEETMKENNIGVLATAHNKNDSAETVLLNLIRGASLDGLSGILPKNGKIIRPLILTPKSLVLEYIKAKNLEYVTDETNLTDIYTRNKIRNKIIPLLESEFNPRLTESLAENAELISCDRDYLNSVAKDAYYEIKNENGVLAERLILLPKAISGRVLQIMWQYETKSGQNLPRKYIDEMLKLAQKAKTAKKLDLPNGFSARIEYGVLFIEKKSRDTDFFIEIEAEKFYELSQIGIRAGIFKEGRGLRISLDGGERLVIRSKRQGDRFCPSGMSGRKTVSDYFTDIKLSHEKRKKTPLLLADDRIAAIGDIRADDAFTKGRRQHDYYFMVEKI